MSDAIFAGGSDGSSSRQVDSHSSTLQRTQSHSEFFDPIANNILQKKLQTSTVHLPADPARNADKSGNSAQGRKLHEWGEGNVLNGIQTQNLPTNNGHNDASNGASANHPGPASAVSSNQIPLPAGQLVAHDDVKTTFSSRESISSEDSEHLEDSPTHLKFNDSFVPAKIPLGTSTAADDEDDDWEEDLSDMSPTNDVSSDSVQPRSRSKSTRHSQDLDPSATAQSSHGQSNAKRYLDRLANSLIKRSSGGEKSSGNKRYIDGIANSLIKRDSRISSDKRYIDSLAGSLIKKEDSADELRGGGLTGNSLPKRYMDTLASSLIKKKKDDDDDDDDDGREADSKDKRYMDTLSSSLIKRDDSQEVPRARMDTAYDAFNKRYIDSLASSLIKRDGAMEKRYVDSLASALIKRNNGKDKRYVDSLAGSLIKREDGNSKRYVDSLAGSLIKREGDNSKRYIDSLAGSLIKREGENNKRYVDSLAGSLIKREGDNSKRYIDSLAGSLIKREGENNKRYVDSLAGSLIKREDGNSKRYVDSLAHSLIKKEDNRESGMPFGLAYTTSDEEGSTNKRYIDSLAQSLIKKDNSDKRYVDSLAGTLTKKDQKQDKRYMDSLAYSLIKKDNSDKRYMDSLAHSLIKKDDSVNKRYMDSLAHSLIKKDSADKRYLDSLAHSLIKKDSADKRYMDSLAHSLIKKDGNRDNSVDFRLAAYSSTGNEKDNMHKRYMDSLAHSLIKKDNSDKRYMDSLAHSLIKKDNTDKRYIDSLAHSLIKKDAAIADKRYVDSLAHSLIKKDDNKTKRYMDSLAHSLIKKDDKSSYRSSREGVNDRRYGEGSVFERDDNGNKRYIDSLAGSLIRRGPSGNKRYIDNLANSLIKRDGPASDREFVVNVGNFQLICRKRPMVPGMRLSQLQRMPRQLCRLYSPTKAQQTPFQVTNSRVSKRAMEVTDDVLDGSHTDSERNSDFLARKRRSVTRDTHQASVPRVLTRSKRSYFPNDFFKLHQGTRQSADLSSDQLYRYLDQIASDVISKRPNNGHRHRRTDGRDETRTIRYDGDDDIYSSLYRNRDDPRGNSLYKRYLDSVASTLIRRQSQKSNPMTKRYIDTLASTLFKREDKSLTPPMRKRFTHIGGGVAPARKRFTLTGGGGGQLELYVNALSRYMPYKRRSGNLFRLYQGNAPPTWSRHNWSNRPPTVPVKKMPIKQNWSVRPTLMSTMISDRRLPVYGNTKSYLRLAMRKYLNDATSQIVGGVTSSGGNHGYPEKVTMPRHTASGDRSRGVNRFATTPFQSESTQDYFDTLAGNILQT